MKRLLLITIAALAAFTPAAEAATINVRVEGQSATLFEGPIATTGRNVQSLSERSTGAIRRCDGTNNGGAFGPTGTAATADALSLLGKGFDGQWFEEYEDYLVSRLGDEVRSWRLFRNDGFTTIGGCQLRLNEGDRVLWAGSSGALLPLTVTGDTATTAAGATVYAAGADGSQGRVLGTADGAGNLALPPDLAGAWHRIKAAKAGMVRSARVDYCPAACPAQKPADMQLRVPPAPVFYGPGGRVLAESPTLATETARVRVTRPSAGTSGYRRGRIAVRWRIADPGVGLLRWAIASDDLTTKSKRWVTRARGTTATSALLALPAGRVHTLRFIATDRLQRDDATDFGRVVVPIDDRAKGVRRAGPWRKLRSKGAWKGTALRGRAGARIRVKLAAGRPTLLVRGKRAARVRIGGRSVRVRSGRRTVLGPRRRGPGTVTVSVIRGSIDLDGVAASP